MVKNISLGLIMTTVLVLATFSVLGVLSETMGEDSIAGNAISLGKPSFKVVPKTTSFNRCSDSDDGIYPEIPGITSFDGNHFYDSCSGDKAIIENYCSYVFVNKTLERFSTYVSCDNACVSAAAGSYCT